MLQVMRARAAATIVIVLLMSMGGCGLIVGDVDGTRGRWGESRCPGWV
jgi:hypothetical protein